MTEIIPTETDDDAAQVPSLRTLTFKCSDCDEAFRIIRALQPQGYWAHIICLASGEITLNLRPLASIHDPEVQSAPFDLSEF